MDATPPAIAIVGLGADHARRARRRDVLGQHQGRPVQHQRRPARALGPGALLRRRPARAGQDLLEDRRLGARLRRGSRSRWKLPIPPQGRRADGRGPAVGGLVQRARRCSTPAGRTGRWTPSGSRSSSATRSAARSTTRTNLRIHVPGVRPRAARLPELRARCPRASASRSSPRRTRPSPAVSPEITEDTMPGELANVLAGRIANLFNFRGPNFTTDAACASGLAAMSAAVGGLLDRQYDVAITGGIDRNMGRRRLRQVLQDRRPVGDRDPAVRRGRRRLRDGRGRGAVRAQAARRRRARRRPHLRACCSASAGPATARARASPRPTRSGRGWRSSGPGDARVWTRPPRGLIEAHGTSTRVGDAAELESLNERVRAGRGGPGHHRAGLGQVQHRPPQGRGGRRRAVQGGRWRCTRRCCRRACTSATRTRTSTGRRSPFARQHRTARLARAGSVRCAVGGRQRVRLRRHQLPRRARGVRARPPPPNGQRSFAGADIPQAASAGNPGTAASGSAGAATASPAGPAGAKAPLRGALVVGARR